MGVHKALSAAEACRALNSSILVETYLEGLTPANAGAHRNTTCLFRWLAGGYPAAAFGAALAGRQADRSDCRPGSASALNPPGPRSNRSGAHLRVRRHCGCLRQCTHPLPHQVRACGWCACAVASAAAWDELHQLKSGGGPLAWF